MSQGQNTENIIQTVNIVGGLLLAAQKSYAEAREIARQAGVSPEVLAESDARYANTLERTRPDEPTRPSTSSEDTTS